MYTYPHRKALVVAIALVALEGLKDERVLSVRHHARPGDPEYTEDKLYILLTNMCAQLKSTGKLNLKDYGMNEGFVADKLAFAQQIGRISYNEWEEVILPIT